MSTTPTAATTTPDRRPTPTLDAVLAAAAAAGGTTAAHLAEATGLGRSTVSKALARLETDDLVRRTPGGRNGTRALPDRWATTDTTPSSPGRPVHPSGRPPTNLAGSAPGRRLGRGELGPLILGYLTDRPGQHLSPTAIAAALGRSAGAVGNALGRLAAAGALTETSAKPRRFTYHPPTPGRDAK